MRILVSGSSGMVGSHLAKFLSSQNHQVVRLVRKPSQESDAIYWNPLIEKAEIEDFEGFDAVIHLAGDNIANSRWTKEKKDQIFLSRARDTWLLSRILLRLANPPKVVICASAVGYYGNRGGETLTEISDPGKGFLADVCIKWEAATEALASKGIRVVNTRFGAILSKEGGMLSHLIPPTRLGLGAIIGTGEQYLSWIALEDVIGAINHVLLKKEIFGPVNFVAPESVTHKEFMRELAHSLGRKIHLRIPAGIARLIFGEMADEMLLASQKAVPHKLLHTGYHFRYPELEEALRSL